MFDTTEALSRQSDLLHGQATASLKRRLRKADKWERRARHASDRARAAARELG